MVDIDVDGFDPHALRATAITNALENDADLEKVQDWVPRWRGYALEEGDYGPQNIKLI